MSPSVYHFDLAVVVVVVVGDWQFRCHDQPVIVVVVVVAVVALDPRVMNLAYFFHRKMITNAENNKKKIFFAKHLRHIIYRRMTFLSFDP